MSLSLQPLGAVGLTFAALQGFADHVSGSPITYLVVLVAAGADVLFPLIPSETIVVTSGVLASRGDLLIWLLIPATAIGAIIGDNIAYFVGAKLGEPLAQRIARSEESQGRLRWSERAIHRRGTLVIVAGRFIPGGRTVTTLAAGTLQMRWRKFIVADIVAAFLWATYVGLLGYLGGAAFRDNLWEPLLASFVAVFLVGSAIEGWRRIQLRRGKDILGDRLAGS
jgi:membrane protein DedA with SNARE-associated domain